jgi:hypothetical protein
MAWVVLISTLEALI